MAVTWQEKSTAALERWIADSEVPRDDVDRIFAGLAAVHDTEPDPDELQRPEFRCPGLTAKPWHEPADFPWTEVLTEGFPDIQTEFLDRYQGLGTHPEAAELALAGSWRTYYFHNMGHGDSTHLDDCPHTAAALAKIDGIESAGMAYFSMMAPHTRVKPHCGFVNTRIRCHLGLVVPEDCWMRVGNETRTWTEGECLVFDDSFEHEVSNESDQPRAVLLLDVWHPELTTVERVAIARLMRIWQDELD